MSQEWRVGVKGMRPEQGSTQGLKLMDSKLDWVCDGGIWA